MAQCKELLGGQAQPTWETVLNAAKKKERSNLELSDWQKYGFAGPRTQEFEQLCCRGDDPHAGVPRIHCKELTREEFWEQYEARGLPCIIDGIPEREGWPAHGLWTIDKFCRRFANIGFKVGKDDSGTPIRVRLDNFAAYMKTQGDDSPLYVFDNKFGAHKDTREQLQREYKVPHFFPDDYMALAGEDTRPPYRWIAMGPRRSGTVMHQDPIYTSAWNTTLVGRKRWVLLPAKTPRNIAKARHVMGKDDDDEAVNVFIDLLPRLREKGLGTVEFVQHAGETVFIPGGWWHCVINLDDTLAVTQNYCGRNNFVDVWRSARTDRPCWSHRWLNGMENKMPALAAKARSVNEMDGFDMGALLQRNRERRARRRERHEVCSLRRARRREGAAFDEAEWKRQRQDEEHSSSDSLSTMSTSTAESTSSDSERSSTSSG